ncbi:uncharacterized protein EDB91DRAFT_1087476 [Suillus paluster]|uniref:uncharacterized protein n=1 Tax=Suillus paluster TaxID=48578 RepID=UPI001B873B39|nr:uncharacterized protein EDB91DRAFT_1087476 [Suillus paluster]KAG1724381.1 hypothetical protein EDB91DRAFT_1087476 [Suillus paluster]
MPHFWFSFFSPQKKRKHFKLVPTQIIWHQDDKHLNIRHFANDLPAISPSLMDHLIPISSLDISNIENITYHSGVPIFSGRKWELNKNAKKQMLKQKQVLDTGSNLGDLETDHEGSSASVAPDTSDQTSGCREYDPKKPNRKPSPKRTEEQKWAHLFNTIYTAMHMAYKKTYPQHSSVFHFEPENHKHPHRQWSLEFCNAPIPDATNVQKPNVVLLDRNVEPKSWAHVLTCVEITESDLGIHRDIPLFKGAITKGYLMMREQPWCRFVVLFSLAANNLRAHYMDHSGLIITRPISIIGNLARLVDMLNTMSLVNSKAHGVDSTMHMCDESCKQTQCDVGDKAIGWIEDKKKERLSIISILWRSQGLFSRRTICYRVWDQHGCEYALKDCWVDEAKKDHEEKVLELVWGIPNVVTLVDAWDVEYEGEPDSTLRIRNLHGRFSPGFCSHKAMVKRNILHGDLSPNNFIISDGRGYFIDFDHALIIAEGNTSVCSRGTTPSDDLESLFYIFVDFISAFDGPKGSIIQPKPDWWADLLEDMGSRAVSYKSGLLLVGRDKELMERTMLYFGGLRHLVQEWRLQFLQADKDDSDSGITPEDIERVLDKWISDEAADEPPPVAQASLLSPTDVLAPPGPRRSSRKTVPVKRP